MAIDEKIKVETTNHQNYKSSDQVYIFSTQ